jgi:hypothetical protein
VYVCVLSSRERSSGECLLRLAGCFLFSHTLLLFATGCRLPLWLSVRAVFCFAALHDLLVDRLPPA